MVYLLKIAIFTSYVSLPKIYITNSIQFLGMMPNYDLTYSWLSNQTMAQDGSWLRFISSDFFRWLWADQYQPPFKHDWLVVWNMAFMTFHSVGNVITPTDELIFQRGRSTTNQIIYHHLPPLTTRKITIHITIRSSFSRGVESHIRPLRVPVDPGGAKVGPISGGSNGGALPLSDQAPGRRCWGWGWMGWDMPRETMDLITRRYL
jgi:hypothetical protein